MICSRCGKTINENDVVVRIEQKIEVYKLSRSNIFTPIGGNLSEPTSELLCEYCFNKYADCIDTLNEDYNGKLLADMVEIVDDIVYEGDC